MTMAPGPEQEVVPESWLREGGVLSLGTEAFMPLPGVPHQLAPS